MSSEEYIDTIYGQVVPFQCDLDDKFDLAIMVDGEEPFIIEPDSNGRSLAEHIDYWVEAQVLVRETDEGFFVRIKDISRENDSWDYTGDSW